MFKKFWFAVECLPQNDVWHRAVLGKARHRRLKKNISVRVFISNSVYVEDFASSHWAGIVLTGNSPRPDQTATVMQPLQIQPLLKSVVFRIHTIPREVNDFKGSIWPHAVILRNYAIPLN